MSPALKLEFEMRKRLTAAEVRPILDQLAASFPHDACSACECFQGFLVQPIMDGDEDVGALIAPLRAARSTMHGCLGCDPCPPGDQHAAYCRADSRLVPLEPGEAGA